MTQKNKLTEQELAQSVVQWLEKDNWVTYKEVDTRTGIIDIVAVKDDIYWAIEVKTKYGCAVLAQAHHHLHYFHKTSVAIPEIRASDREGRMVLDFFAREKGIGTIKVWQNPYTGEPLRIDESIKPVVNNNARVDCIKKFLFDEQKQSVAGSTAGGCITSYKLTVMRIKEYLRKTGTATVADIVKNIKHHYSSDSSAKNSLARHLTWFDKEIKKKNEDGKTFYYLEDNNGVV